MKGIRLKIARIVNAIMTFETYKSIHKDTKYENEKEYNKAMNIDDSNQNLNKDNERNVSNGLKKKSIENEIADKAVSDMTKSRQNKSKKKVNKKSLNNVKNVLSANGINEDSDELQEMANFKDTLGQRVPDEDVGKWYVRNVSKLKKDFISNMSPSSYESVDAFKSTKERISKMSNGDFGKVLAAIMSDDTDENIFDSY